MSREDAARAARELHERLTKPPGSLGQLEELGIQLAAIYGECPPPVLDTAVVIVFAGDHGVLAEGVTPWPQEVTAQMVANFCAGGAAINVLARQAGAEVVVVDVGVAAPVPDHPVLLQRNVRRGAGNIAIEPAMTADEVERAIAVGAHVARSYIEDGARVLITGDMGIGNTTPSAALIAAYTGRSPADVTGRGTGIDDATWRRKVAVVERALARAGDNEPLAEVGGLEIAALAGFIGAATVPVIVDGVIGGAALLAAYARDASVVDHCVAGHLSTEPGAAIALAHVGLEPVLDLGLRLGEGTGAVLALHMLRASALILREMATFDQAGIARKEP